MDVFALIIDVNTSLTANGEAVNAANTSSANCKSEGQLDEYSFYFFADTIPSPNNIVNYSIKRNDSRNETRTPTTCPSRGSEANLSAWEQ